MEHVLSHEAKFGGIGKGIGYHIHPSELDALQDGLRAVLLQVFQFIELFTTDCSGVQG
jgi:hypothetical protein